MTTFADIKRDIFVLGKHLTMTRLAWLIDGREVEAGGRLIGVERVITKVQSNSVRIGDSWLSFGKASEWSLDGDTLTNKTEDTIIVYKVGA